MNDDISGPDDLSGPDDMSDPDDISGPDDMSSPDDTSGPDDMSSPDDIFGPDDISDPDSTSDPDISDRDDSDRQDDLDRRLRSGFRALVAEAPAPPPLPSPTGPVRATPGRRRLVLAVAVAGLLVVTGISVAIARRSGGDGATASRVTTTVRHRAARPAMSLADTRWELVTARRGQSTVNRPDPSRYLRFARTVTCDGPDCHSTTFSGFDGCNQFSGTVWTIGGQTTIGGLLPTHEDCAQRRGRPDPTTAWFGFLEQGGARITVSANRLELTGSDQVSLEFEPYRAVVPLVGTDWKVVATAKDGKITPIPPGVVATLEFAVTPSCTVARCTSTQVAGSDGCNDFGYTVTITGGQIDATSGGSTLVGCADDGVQPYLLPFRRFTLRLVGGQLRLTGSGGTTLVYEPTLDVLGPIQGSVVDEGRHGGGDYRLSSGGFGPMFMSPGTRSVPPEENLTFAWSPGAPAEPGQADAAGVTTVGLVAGEQPLDTVTTIATGTDRFVFGFAPTGTATVTWGSTTGATTTLPTTRLQLVPPVIAFGGFVPGASGGSTVTAWSRSGAVLGTHRVP